MFIYRILSENEAKRIANQWRNMQPQTGCSEELINSCKEFQAEND